MISSSRHSENFGHDGAERIFGDLVDGCEVGGLESRLYHLGYFTNIQSLIVLEILQ